MGRIGNYRTYYWDSNRRTHILGYFRKKSCALKNQRALKKRGIHVKIQKKPKWIHGKW